MTRKLRLNLDKLSALGKILYFPLEFLYKSGSANSVMSNFKTQFAQTPAVYMYDGESGALAEYKVEHSGASAMISAICSQESMNAADGTVYDGETLDMLSVGFMNNRAFPSRIMLMMGIAWKDMDQVQRDYILAHTWKGAEKQFGALYDALAGLADSILVQSETLTIKNISTKTLSDIVRPVTQGKDVKKATLKDLGKK